MISSRTLPHFLCFLFLLSFNLGCSGGSKKKEADSQKVRITEHAIVLLEESKRALATGDFQEALSLIDSAEKFAPNYVGVHFIRGQVFDKLKMFDQSEESYAKVLSIDPQHRGVHFNLGNNAFNEGKFQKAVNEFRNELNLNKRTDVLVNMARAYSNIYELDSARSALMTALAIDSSFASAYILMGQLSKDLGEIDKGIEYTKRAVELDPSSIDNQYFLGSMLFQAGEFQKALPYLEAVSDKRPWDYWAHNNLGLVLIRLGNKEDGEKYLSIANSLQNLESEIENARNQAQSNPYNIINWLVLGDQLRKMGRLEEAAEVYKVAVFLDSKNIFLREKMGLLYLAIGDTTNAVYYLSKVLQEDETKADSWFNLGIIYANKGDYKEAEDAFENTLKYSTGDTMALQLLSQVRILMRRNN
jgi:tetratricopeptide (TPR) repeat protein|tara:strand:- start:4853 stop:6100 length:1248 start_codon:yes stop_codon:yes gene_type:complete